MKKILYFAYGSNMFYDRIFLRLGKVENCGVHKLRGYKLIFNAEASWGQISYANIIQTNNQKDYVEGVLYGLTPKQYNTLDLYEGLYNRFYFDINRDTLGCVYIYTKNVVEPYYPPEDHYIKICLKGAIENNLTKTIKLLQHELTKERENWG
jgi:gamma-glutamylcyclotransferase